jgi:hypothetical protein
MEGSSLTQPSTRILSRPPAAETQVLCHAHGYVPTEKDLRDMELLQGRFGVELPPHLRRSKV